MRIALSLNRDHITDISRGINGGSKHDLEDLCAAVEATQMRFHDTIDRVFPFEESEEAIDFVWQGKQVGKVVLEL